MGRLLIFLAVILVALGLLGLWGLFLSNRKERATAGLQDSQKRIDALEARKTRQATALQEIHDLAETEITLAAGNPDASMWQVVQGLAAEALKEKDKP